MADFSICTSASCKTETPGIVDKCPVCGGRVITSRRVRLMGWLSIACGVFLVLFMGYITMVMYPSLTNAGMSVEGGRWTGTAEQAQMVLNLFYTVVGFGVLATAAGIWQVVTGRRHILIMIVTLVAAAALILQAWQAVDSIKKAEDAQQSRRIAQPPPVTPANLSAPDKPQQ
jgi:hypothetical protein